MARRELLTILPVVMVLATTASCQTGRIPVYPVRGQVLYRGRPAPHALIALHRTGDGAEVSGLAPRAVADKNGEFQLTTYSTGDGAPAGVYRVSIRWPRRDPEAPAASQDPEDQGHAGDQLQGRYANPQTSGILVTIHPRHMRLDPFETH